MTRPVVAELSGEHVLLRSPCAATQIRIHVSDFARLATTREGISPRSKDSLLELGWLKYTDNITQDKAPELPPPWDQWGVIAWAFHDATAKVRFISRVQPEQVDQWLNDLAETSTPPATGLQQMKHKEAIIPLPRQSLHTDRDFSDVLYNRRTVRDFDDTSLSLNIVSDILRAGFGPTDFVQSGELGHMELRPSLSGGAIHETSAILISHTVDDLESGTYVYDQIRHGLIPIREIDFDYDRLESLTADQGSTKNTAFSILSVSDSARLSWKYQDARAYRVLLMNAGCVAQIVSMTAYALGVGAAVTAALDEGSTTSLFRLEKYREIPMFLFSIGLPSANKRFDPGPLEPRTIGGIGLGRRRDSDD